MDPGIGILLFACVVGCYFAACNVALKHFNRKRLGERLEQSGHLDRFEVFLKNLDHLILLTGSIRALMNLLVLLAMLLIVDNTRWIVDAVMRDLAALVLAGVVVSLVSVAIPSSWARYAGEGLLAGSMPILNSMVRVCWPITHVLQVFDPLIRRLSGSDLRGDDDDAISDQVLSIVAQHDEHGAVNDRQKEMLEAVFDLSRTLAGEIMTPRTDVQGIEVSSTLSEVRDLIIRDGRSRYPVFEESLDNIVGVLYAKDMLRYIGGECEAFDIRQVLREAVLVPESKPVQELLAEFKARKVHIAIVLDEYGGTAGLVTVEDIVEEVVGDIQDEYEEEEESPTIRRIDEQTCEVDGRVYVDDLNDQLNTTLPEDEDYDTVGGFVFSSLGHIPEVGESFEFDNLRMTVIKAERTRVNRVRIEWLATAGNGSGADRKAV